MQKEYSDKKNAFLFDFVWGNATWCIDASRDDDSLSRLVNDDDISPNCKVKKLTIQGTPHLCLFAIKNIPAETEITYNYGDSQWPWRALIHLKWFHGGHICLNHPGGHISSFNVQTSTKASCKGEKQMDK
ncbi:histone-lysine N-methyltransferase set-1-like [Larimichthys crocea]|uniref:histone-lysine N-methyltransferase set-1-like n=1 Tax=Larimichthys crocea TaxID=215358 RepID=UPI000F5EA6A6|nr:histone-lysine N-methyltransferase set-1-like [Larimichthys crocea]